jgi:predicted dehydrogenase
MNKKVCVVGAGRWGKNHIKALHGLGYLRGIIEADTDIRLQFQEKYPDVMTFSNIKDAAREDFDGFTVATPAETHFEIAEFIARLSRGGRACEAGEGRGSEVRGQKTGDRF